MQQVDRWTRFASEDLARAMDRRAFLKRAGSTAFGFLVAVATGQAFLRPGQASAAPGPLPPHATPLCSPPGPYCNSGGGDLSGCQGAHCFQHRYNGKLYQCRTDYTYYQAGCWTTAGQGGYWTCCDCECGQPVVTYCGCAQFSLSPNPLPMRPSGVQLPPPATAR